MSDYSDFKLSGSENELSDESDNFKEIMQIYHKEMKSKKSMKQPKLPKEISQLMGEANQLFMFSKFDEATQNLYEIIRQYPNFPEPYHLLGLICEEKQQLKKAANFFSLAAELSQNDGELWQKIGYLYKSTKCFEQACYCFGRALKSNPLNTQIIMERASCFEIIGDLKNAIKQVEKVLAMTPDNLNLVKKCSKLLAKNNQTQKSMELLKPFITLEDGLIDMNILHMICEIQILEENYKECVEIMEQYINFKDQDSYQSIPPELVTIYGLSNASVYKIILYLIDKIGEQQKANKAFKILQTYDCETYIDLYLQAIQVLEKSGDYEQCLEIYEQIMLLEEYNNEDTWLKAGVLYTKIHDYESAIDAFKAVIEKNPQIYEARVQLSNLYYNQGSIDEALKILENQKKAQPKQQIRIKEEQYLDFQNQDDDDDIFYSDEDPIEQQKVKEQIQDELNEVVYKKVKKEVQFKEDNIRDDIKDDYQKIPLSQDEMLEGKSFSEKIDEKILKIQNKYNIDEIRLNFRQVDILLESPIEPNFIEKTFDNLIQALKLENSVNKVKTKVLNRYLYESRKRTFKKAIKSKNILKNIDQMKQTLIITSKKQKDSQEFLMKKKTKLSKILTEKHLENVIYISKLLGKEKLLFYIEKYLIILNEQNDYKRMALLCWKSFKLDFLLEFQKQHNDILFYGIYSSSQIKDFDQAFHYIKYFARRRPESSYIMTVLCRILNNLQDPLISRTFISKLIVKQNKNSLIQQIIGQGYLQHSFYELSIKNFFSLHQEDETNTLINLQLGISYLQYAISRSTKNKQQSCKRAFYFFNKYFKYRSQHQTCESYYNVGRAYAQISMYNQAFKYFEKTILHYQELKNKGQNCESSLPIYRMAVYNIIILHKFLGNHEIAAQISDNYFTIN